MVFKAEERVDLIDQTGHAFDLLLDLLRGHEDMGIVLGKAAHPHQPVELAGFLVAVYQSQLTHAQGKIPVGAGLGSIDQDAARAVHGLHGIVCLIDHCGIHVVLIMIPVSGGLPQAAVQDDRGGDLHIAGLFVDLPPVV